jgi:TolA-binding protein
LDNPPASITAQSSQPRTSAVAQTMSALQPSVLDQLSQLASIPRADTFSPPGQFATPSRAAPAFVQSRSIVSIQERPRNDAQRIVDLEQQLASAEQRIQFLTAALQHVSIERVRFENLFDSLMFVSLIPF